MSSLKVKDLTVQFQDGNIKRTILKDVNTSFESGKAYAIIGRSGSGKSTFLNCLMGKIKNDALFYNDELVDNFTIFKRNKLGFLNQKIEIVDYLNPIENVILGTYKYKHKDKNKKVIKKILENLGIKKNLHNKRCSKLSGGEKQRVALSRALYSDKEILIADEPTGNLDVDTENLIMDEIIEYAREYDKIVIVVTHAVELANKFDVVYEIKNLNLIKL